MTSRGWLVYGGFSPIRILAYHRETLSKTGNSRSKMIGVSPPRLRRTKAEAEDIRLRQEALKTEVLAFARERFRADHGRDWNDAWSTALKKAHARAEAEDRHFGEVLIELRAALSRAERVLQEAGLLAEREAPNRGGGPLRGRSAQQARERSLRKAGERASALADWLNRTFPHGAVDFPELPPARPRTFRAFLIERFAQATQRAGRGLPKALGDCFITDDGFRTRTLPSHVDLAMVSLLCGEFPGISSNAVRAGLSAQNVVEREADALRKARGHVLWDEGATIMGADELTRLGMRLDFSESWARAGKPEKKL